MKQKMGLPGSKHSRPPPPPPPDDEDDSETEIIESSLSGEASEENDAGDTLPCENTALLENTVPLEDTAVLENTVLLDTEVVGDDKNQGQGLLLKGSNRVNDAENAYDLERDTEIKTQLLEDFQEDNFISGLRDKTHVHIVADSDEGGGETEVFSEDDDASDGRSSPRIVDKLKHKNIRVEAVPFPNSCHTNENAQTQSSNMGKKTSFNSAYTHVELEQRAVVDSDASTEDETDVGDLQQHRGLYASGCGQVIDNCSLPQKSIQDKNQLDDSLVLLHDPHQEKKNDSHKSTSILVSDGLKVPKASQGVSSSSQMETVPTSNRITRGNSSDFSLGSVSKSRNIASVRAASLRASGLRASEMLYKTKEVTGIQGCKTEVVGNNDSATRLIPEMPTSVQAINNLPIYSSYPNSRGECLTARRLFSDTEDMEVDKLETKDDKPSSINGNEEDDAQGVKDGKDDEQMATVGDEKDYKQSSAVVDKDYAGPNIKGKIEKYCNPRKQASNTVNSQQHNSIGIHDLCFDKRSEPCSTNTGLSYLGSQDPGEQSQADALNMVDKLVWLNTTGFSQDQEPTKLPLMTRSGLSKTKGPQNLAHLVESKSPNEKIEVFDWVDIENKDGGQYFNNNGSSVLVSTGASDKVDSESKQTKRRSYKGKRGSSVLNTKANKTGKDASKILLQGLQKFARSGSSKFGSDDRENKLHSADNVILSDRLEPGEDINHDNKQTGHADKQRETVENLPLNYVEASDKEDIHTHCRNALDLSGIGNDTQLAAEAMQIMRSETSPNRVTKENTHKLAERGGIKFRESKKINGTNLGKATYEALEGHDSRKRTLPNTDYESLENCEKQQKTSKNSVASRGRSRRVHCTEYEGELQNKHEVKKHVRPTKSKQNGKEELEPKADNMGSENIQENQDVVKKVRGRRRKGSNLEEKSTSAGEILSAGRDARVGRITRQTRKVNQGEMHETETSSKKSGADEEIIFEDSAKIAEGKKNLATDDLEKNAGGAQPVGKTLEGMQPHKDISVVQYNRQIKRNNAEKQKPETRSKTKSPKNEELENAATSVKRKRKQETLQDTQYKQGVSTRQSSKSQPTKEIESTGAHAEENINLNRNPEIHYDSGDTLPNFAKAVRTKITKNNKEGSSFKPGQSISVAGLCADTSDQEMHQKVGETAVHITRQSMRISRPESTTFALTAIDGDKSDLNDTAPRSGLQGRKSNRRSTRITTPHGLKLPNHGNLACADKCEMDLNDTSVDARSPATRQTPQNANFKSPTSAVHGNKTTHSSTSKLQRKGTPKSTLKRELVRLTATETSLSPILKDSARKRRESGSIYVLFSHSLDDDIVKQQKKILTKLGGQPTTSPVDCTHFVTDKFVRTRNMLEAMASGKPVVTHLWLKNCGQASYFIDEKNYILRDDKKEKELGFSMPASLASAQQKPLLEGKQVFVTPNTNPGQELIISLVKAAKGQVLNGLKGAFSKKEKNIESVIVISCEEDYEVCAPFLEKGARIYSPEFLLNGIVIQRLDSSRDHLFADHVKRGTHLRQQT